MNSSQFNLICNSVCVLSFKTESRELWKMPQTISTFAATLVQPERAYPVPNLSCRKLKIKKKILNSNLQCKNVIWLVRIIEIE